MSDHKQKVEFNVEGGGSYPSLCCELIEKHETFPSVGLEAKAQNICTIVIGVRSLWFCITLCAEFKWDFF